MADARDVFAAGAEGHGHAGFGDQLTDHGANHVHAQDFIRHRIGHGMGVEGHEAPWLAPGDATASSAGMVFSCEPGIYRPGLDGWRTIETLIVGTGAVEVASRFQTTHPPETRTLPL